jgi:hypothetical protein
VLIESLCVSFGSPSHAVAMAMMLMKMLNAYGSILGTSRFSFNFTNKRSNQDEQKLLQIVITKRPLLAQLLFFPPLCSAS